ncbi:MAG: hypothetical protein ACREFD_18965 [Stellaceae bacterium]
MALAIETFSNLKGGNAFFKAVTHPLAARRMVELIGRLQGRRVAIFDPDGVADALGQIHDLRRLDLAGVFVQDVTAIGRSVLGRRAEPITVLKEVGAAVLLVASFDAARLTTKLLPLMPAGIEIVSLDAIRIPESLLSNKARYLDNLNFATNFVFFRDAGGLHTRLQTADYWHGYGAGQVSLWLLLFDAEGNELQEWTEEVPPGGAILLDSRVLRDRFGLDDFAGQLFCHAVGIAGHDVVKYALDIFGDGTPATLSATHDANSWPADFYAGLPAPRAKERVVLWVQNSLPCPIPAGAISLNLMGGDETRALDRPVPPFASFALDVASLWPETRWPQQFEVSAGKFFVRPRYEIIESGRRAIAHANVERTDLIPDPKLAELGNLFGKGFLLPAPILPRRRWRSIALPTPMARTQKELPIALLAYDASGEEVARRALGRLPRDRSVAIDLDELLDGAELPSGAGHLELVYDFAEGGVGDGWLHGLFRYEDRGSGHRADTSFGAHIFNTALTYRNEPQSYSGHAPGLSTRLFLRLGEAPLDTFCHLIYPASRPWHTTSATELILHDRVGGEIARRHVAIPCSGSCHWRYCDMFNEEERTRAAGGGFVLIRDLTCRLFGYHGLLGPDGAFSLDHMFGF